MKLLCSLLLLALPLVAQFEFRETSATTVTLYDGGVPVYAYNYGTMLPAGVPADRARCCYLHPVYAPNGAIITDDFPVDHYHHRGIAWMWPVVKVDGTPYDLWLLNGIKPRFEKWLAKENGRLHVQVGWYVGERKVVNEETEIIAQHVAGARRDLEIAGRFTAVGADVVLAGSQDGKGYGGLNLRFAPRTGTRIDTAAGQGVPDSDRQPLAWAELTGDFGGKLAGARITTVSWNPGHPHGWTLRHYGFLGVHFPGLPEYRLDQPLELKYRVTLIGGEKVTSQKKVLVFTRNGKGYVHDNISASAEAIRKMGRESGFAVDVTEDNNFFTDATLRGYDAVVFANTNNEAFYSDAQREALQRFIQRGGGYVGIHSASASERTWPWYWKLAGGKFLRHPPLQKFTVRVVDPQHASTRGMPATFEWEDEPYLHEYLNPAMRPLLETDTTKLNDPDREKHPVRLGANHFPLAWTLDVEGSRQFYTSLGHKIEHYSSPLLYAHLRGGILWVLGVEK